MKDRSEHHLNVQLSIPLSLLKLFSSGWTFPVTIQTRDRLFPLFPEFVNVLLTIQTHDGLFPDLSVHVNSLHGCSLFQFAYIGYWEVEEQL